MLKKSWKNQIWFSLRRPSGVASQLAQPFVETDFPVIDLSGDHRLPADSYEKWYKKHQLVMMC